MRTLTADKSPSSGQVLADRYQLMMQGGLSKKGSLYTTETWYAIDLEKRDGLIVVKVQYPSGKYYR